MGEREREKGDKTGRKKDQERNRNKIKWREKQNELTEKY